MKSSRFCHRVRLPVCWPTVCTSKGEIWEQGRFHWCNQETHLGAAELPESTFVCTDSTVGNLTCHSSCFCLLFAVSQKRKMITKQTDTETNRLFSVDPQFTLVAHVQQMHRQMFPPSVGVSVWVTYPEMCLCSDITVGYTQTGFRIPTN